MNKFYKIIFVYKAFRHMGGGRLNAAMQVLRISKHEEYLEGWLKSLNFYEGKYD